MTTLARSQHTVGDRFLVDDSVATLETISIEGQGFVRLRLPDGIYRDHSTEDFRAAVARGDYRRVRIGGSKIEPEPDGIPLPMTEDEQATVEARSALLQHVARLRKRGFTWDQVMQELSENGYIIEGRRERCALKRRRLQDLYGKWLKNGSEALRPQIHRRGNRRQRYDSLYEVAANRVIDRFYSRSELMRVSAACQLARREYLIECRAIGVDPGPCGPRAFQSVLDQHPQLDLLSRRLDRRAARRVLRAAVSTFKDLAPLDRVELDCKNMTVSVRDELMNSVGRAWICAAIDVATRSVLAATITLESPSAEVVLQTLKSAVQPSKEKIMKEIGSDISFDPYGAINELVFDRGSENMNGLVKGFLFNLGLINPNDTPGKPERRPHIERFFGTLSEFMQQLPGGTNNKRRLAEKHTERAIERGNLTVDELQQLVLRFIHDDYHHRPNKELSRRFGKVTAPADAWRLLGGAIALNCPPSPEELYRASLVPIGERLVQHYGIDVYGTQYHSHSLAKLREVAGHGVKVNVWIDPSDMRQVTVVTKDGGQEFRVDCRWDMPAMTRKDLQLFLKSITPTLSDTEKADAARARILGKAYETASSKQRLRDVRRAAQSRKRGKDAIQRSHAGPALAFDEMPAQDVSVQPIVRSGGLSE